MKKHLFSITLLLFVVATGLHAQETKLPTTPDFTNAMEALQQGDIFTSDSLLNEEVVKYPKNGYAWLYRGILYTRLQADTALVFLDQAVRHIPKKDNENLATAHYWRGIAKWKFNDDFTGMMDEMNTAKRTNPNTAEPYLAVGTVLQQRGDYGGAEQEFRQALTKGDVKKSDAYQFLGRNKAAQDDYSTAIKYYNQALEFDRNDETIYIDRSQAYIATHQDQEGIADAIQAFKLEYSKSTFDYMVDLADSTALRDQVVARIQEEIHNVGNPTMWNYALSRIYDYADNAPESLRYLLRASKSNDEPLYEQIADLFAGVAVYDQAADYYYRAYRQAQTDSAEQSSIDNLFNSYIGYTFSSGDPQKAIQVTKEKMATQDELDQTLLYNLMTFQYYHGDYANAMASLEQYRDSFAFSYDDFLFSGKIYRENGLMERAYSEFRDCATDNAIEEDSSTAELALALLGENERARELYEKRLAEDADIGLQFNSACLMALLDDKPMAVNILRQMFEKGFRNFYRVERNEDLRSLKGYGDYEALLKEYKAKFEVERKALLDVLEEETREEPIPLVGE